MTGLMTGLELYVLEGDDRGRILPLAVRRITIGRRTDKPRRRRGIASGPTLRIELNDPTISEVHVQLTWEPRERRYLLQHRSTTNPTLVNGHAVAEAVLRPNDVVQLGHTVLRVVYHKPMATAAAESRALRRAVRQAMRQGERARLFGHLAVMLDAGLPLTRAVEALAEQGPDDACRGLMEKMLQSLTSGRPLSKAMSGFEVAFTSIEINLVRAGESVGSLSDVLRDLARWDEGEAGLARRVAATLIYPTTVLVCGLVLIFGLGNYLLDGMLPFLLRSGIDLPPMTRLLVGILHLQQNAMTDVLLLLVLAGAWQILRTIPEKRRHAWRDRVLLRLPVCGSVARHLAGSRFCHALSLLVRHGVPVLEAIHLSAACSGNTVVAEKSNQMTASVQEGSSIHDALLQAGFLPWAALDLIAVGEASGRLPDMLARSAAFLETQADDALQRAAAAVEPLAILIVGLFVGFLVVAIILPMYQVVARL